MTVVSMRKMLENGVHFGHQTRKWNPKMKQYIYTAKNNVYIIDLAKTQAQLDKAYDALKKITEDGGKVLFVGTKKQAQAIVLEEAIRSGSFYVNQRWLGGTLTNFRTIQKSIKKLVDIEEMEANETITRYTKKEQALLLKQKDKLENFLGGIKEMRRLPSALFVVDPKAEHNAVAEARILGIPVFGIVDTNCDPDLVDYVIPANDDAVRAVKIILGVLANAINEGTDREMVDFLTDDDKNKNANKESKKESKKSETKEVKAEAKKEEVKETVEEIKAEDKEDLSKKTVAELKEMAKAEGIEGYSKLKKSELLEILNK